MRPAMTRALGEAQVGLLPEIIHALGGELPDALGQQLGVVRRLHELGNLGFRQLGAMQHQGLVLDQRPFDGRLGAIDIEALTVLAGGVEQRAVDARAEVALRELDVGGLDGERGVVLGDQFVADGARAEAAHVFGVEAEQAGDGTHAVRGVPHGRQAGPVVGPAIHVLLMRRLEELHLAQHSLFVEFADVEELPGVHDRLHHHVLQPGLLHQLHDLLAVLDAGRHGHRTGDVLARLERGDGHPAVVGDGRVDVDGINVGILEDVGKLLVADRDIEGVPDGVQLLLVALADGVAGRFRVALPDGDEFRAEAQSDDGDVDLAFAHGDAGAVTMTFSDSRFLTGSREKLPEKGRRGYEELRRAA
jgi:hypothetical protein